jgi:glycolate oxidase
MLNLLPDVEPPARSAVDRALALLHRRLGASKVLSSAEACEAYARDESEAPGRSPDAVVLATGVDDIAAALAVASETGVPITPRAGGTGRVGGAVPVAGGIVLSVLGMDQIKDIDTREGVAVVGPGVVLSDFHHAVEREGWFYPPDPNSLSGCTLGGNAATNAGGPRTFKYGTTRNYVLGLEAMLIGGQRFFAGRRTPKGVAGYDVAGLLVGSEGTLAMIGDLTLRLVPKPEEIMTLLVLFDALQGASGCVAEIIAAGVVPRCIELLDEGTLDAVRAAGNPIDERAKAMLLIEIDGEGEVVEHAAMRVNDICEQTKALDILAAQDPAQRDRLWAARREMSPAVRRMAKHKLSEDIVVPRQKVVELLERNRRTTESLGVQSVTYGHAGDGNLHVNFLWNEPDDVPNVNQAIEQLFQNVVQLGGTLSGEHGIGVLKAPYLHLEQNQDLIAVQKDIKRVFDPRGLLNPGKIFMGAGGHGPC